MENNLPIANSDLRRRALALLTLGFAALLIPRCLTAQAGPVAQDAKSPSLGAPTVPVEEIIQKFAAKEAEFKAERENFTYKQTFVFQTLDEDNRVDGEYRLKSDIDFTAEGKRTEVVTYAPQSTLQRVDLTQEDFNDLANIFPFVLTTADISNYNITYVDHKALDELTTYVFDVSPKTVGKKQRFFEGRVWVDDKDFQIVKTYGKAVGYAKKSRGGNEQFFPHFETFRENIEGKYWFPTYTRSDEIVHLGPGDNLHVRMTVKYEDYKRYGSTVKITSQGQAPQPKEQQPEPNEKK